MSWDVDKAIATSREKAQPNSTGHCARYTREAIEAGGISLGTTLYAKDYGAKLLLAGFTEVTPKTGPYKAGDVVIIQDFPPTNTQGHMALFDGSVWISDFVQRDLYPGPGYRTNKPDYKVYRHQ